MKIRMPRDINEYVDWVFVTVLTFAVAMLGVILLSGVGLIVGLAFGWIA